MRPETVRGRCRPEETPPITRSDSNSQRAPLAASGKSLDRSSMIGNGMLIERYRRQLTLRLHGKPRAGLNRRSRSADVTGSVVIPKTLIRAIWTAELMADMPLTAASKPQRVLVLGATGTIGRATVRALMAAGHETVCFLRPRPDGGDPARLFPTGAVLRFGDVTDPQFSAARRFRRRALRCAGLLPRLAHGRAGGCLGHRLPRPCRSTGRRASGAGVRHMVLLSAICVQKPKLAFQHAKLAFEAHADRTRASPIPSSGPPPISSRSRARSDACARASPF